MADKVLMLALSPTMTEGTIAVWKVKEGDEVRKGAVLCEVETDKAVMDYESSSSGTLLKIIKGAGDKALVGDLIAVIGKVGEDVSAIAASAAVLPKTATASPGNAAAATVPTEQPAPATHPRLPAAQASQPAQGAAGGPVYAPGIPRSSPLARVLARNGGADLRAIPGSGPGGRIVKRDVEAYLAEPRIAAGMPSGVVPSAGAPAGAAVGRTAVPAKLPVLEDKVVPLSRIRATVARRLSESMREAPHFFLRAAVDAERLLDLRSRLNDGRDDKLSLNSLFVKLAASAISRHPAVNASWGGDSIRYRRSVDVALAVALPDGLVAPVVRDCANKGIERIELEFRELIARAKSGALKPEDFEDASFTVSNLGAWGVEEFTAIINPPGSAILALGAVAKEPVVHTGSSGADEVVIRPMFRATLSCDHRVIDGAVGAAFLKDLKAFFEEPAKALL